MCYARNLVTETYKSFEWLLRNVDLAKGQVSLIASVRKYSWTLSARQPANLVLRGVSDGLCGCLRALKDAKINVLGGKANATVAPRFGEPNVIDINIATIAVIHPAVEPGSLGELLGDKYRHVNDPLAGHLSELIAWSMKYPVGMLRGDAAVAIDLLRLTAASRSRLSVSTGMLRQARAAIAAMRQTAEAETQ